MSFVFLGYQKADAATNLALDEAALSAAEKNQKTYIRFYDFERPVVILSYRQGKEDVNFDRCKELGVDVARRLSGGTAILCDENTLAYSISSPHHDPDTVHKYFGPRIAGILKNAGVENITVGEHFSVRINGHTVAGHGQRYRPGKAVLYHGVIAVDPWDHELINDVISLRPPREEGGMSEYDLVKKLPAISNHIQLDKKTIAGMMLDAFTDGQYEVQNIDVLYRDAEEKRQRYVDESWTLEGVGDNVSRKGFCFIARKEKQYEFY